MAELKTVLGAAMLLVAGIALAQMPSDDAMNKAMQAAQRRAESVMGEAQRQALPNNVTMPRMIPKFDGASAGGVDPGAIAESYKNLGKASNSDAPQLMIFVSLSMPEESLKRIGAQAKKAGAIVGFRGLKYGLSKGAWTNSLNALKPIADTGAEVQIHPELFTRYNVTAVPTLVVAAAPKQGCQDDACAAQSASVVGDVTMDYALERLTDRKDEIGEIARTRMKRLRNS